MQTYYYPRTTRKVLIAFLDMWNSIQVYNFTFINELEDYETIVYNQIIAIPLQAPQQRELDKKKKKHEGAANNSPSNAIIAEEIQTLLHNIAIDGQLVVNAHFSILFSTNTLEEMEGTQSLIENKLFTKGIIVSKNAYNQLELFRSAIPGNATELREYDLFMTTSEAALCFFFKESYPVNEESNFYLRFTDRQGVPLKVDPSDLPMKTGRINSFFKKIYCIIIFIFINNNYISNKCPYITKKV
jgi:type IV secretory pathway VirB4 component